MTICGLACQKEDVVVRGGATDALFSGAVMLDVAVAPDDEGMGAVAVSGAFEAALTRFFSVFSFSLSRSLRSFSFFSRLLGVAPPAAAAFCRLAAAALGGGCDAGPRPSRSRSRTLGDDLSGRSVCDDPGEDFGGFGGAAGAA